MFHLAPVGLQPTRPKSSQQSVLAIERNVLTAIGDITDSAYNSQKGSFNLTHPDTRALIKALDEFFSHGSVNDGKCYWAYVREYIPAVDHEELRKQWNCTKLRSASLAWLKDSLNRSTLHFQMLAFIPNSAANSRLKARWYAKHACMRNNVMLKRVCMAVERLSLIEFNIESPYVFRAEETPIAVAHHSPLHGVAQMESLTPRITDTRPDFDTSSPMSIGDNNANRQCPQPISTVTSGYLVPASLNAGLTGGVNASSSVSDELPPNSSYLQSLTSDLPEVKVPSSVHEPTVGNQDFMLEEVLRAHKSRAVAGPAMDDVNEAEDEIPILPTTTSNAVMHRPTSIEEAEGEDDLGERLSDLKIAELDAHPHPEDESRNPIAAEPPSTSLLVEQELKSPRTAVVATAATEGSDYSALLNNSSAIGDELSDDPAALDDTLAVEGDEEVDSGTIIQLASEVFKENGEKFNRMFRVFVGHSTGHPQLRHLLITNLHIYLISAEQIPDAAGNDDEFGARVGSWIGFDSFRIGSLTRNDDSSGFGASGLGRPSSSLLSRPSLLGAGTGGMRRRSAVRYRVHLEMRLSEIDYVTVGVDSQILCFHLKRWRPAPLGSTESKYERYEKKTHVVETASYPLGRLISQCVKRVMIDYNTMLSVSPDGGPDSGSAKPAVDGVSGGKQEQCTLIFTHSTQLSIIMKRFTKKELSLPYVEIIHHSLVYWLERPERERLEGDELEGYLYVRDVGSRSWLAGGRSGEWQHSYFVLRGPMLYQFADSTCKFAVRSLNVKECIERVELTADGERHTFEAVLNEEASLHSVASEGPPRAIQFSCPDETELKRWLTRLSRALSTPSGSPMPVACMLIVTDTNILFAQEGTNCIVDGFMRCLANLWINRISAIYALRTETQCLLVVKREDGMQEWISVRDERELNRLVATFAERWRFPVEDCLEGENFSKPEFSRMFKQCASLPDTWTDPTTTVGEGF